MTSAGVLLLAVIDSINPSAIVVTLGLLAATKAQVLLRVLVYVGAVFTTNLLFGAAMLLGIGALLPSPGALFRSPPVIFVQILIGLALLLYCLTARTKGASSRIVPHTSARPYASLVLLGVSVTLLELPAAFPYFAAIALIVEASFPVRAWVPLLWLYNLIFVFPPMVLLAGYFLLRERLAERYAALGQRLQSNTRGNVLWVAGLVGCLLILTGTFELLAPILQRQLPH